jgi:hypothetical protein
MTFKKFSILSLFLNCGLYFVTSNLISQEASNCPNYLKEGFIILKIIVSINNTKLTQISNIKILNSLALFFFTP